MTAADPPGRLTATVSPEVEHILYGQATPAEVAGELTRGSTVDLAHVVMLAECGLVSEARAARLLRHIAAARDDGFAAVVSLPRPRGLYLAYERHLVEVAGPDAGGTLHTARSRNDLKATVAALRLRDALAELVDRLLSVTGVLLARADAHRATVMPVHTHFQAALPVTYGYHLLGVALALGRDVDGLVHAARGLRRCPLGAGAAAGTELSIDPARTAALLGFEEPPLHALDAVASRDAALGALAAAAGAGLTLSRLATDLQLWSTAEFGFVTFPDSLVGGSSAMPQKRNAFLLEYVKAKAGTAIGAWTAAAAQTRSAPFTNSIEVGTEAVASTWPGLAAVGEAAVLARELVGGARPVAKRMRASAEEGFVGATAVANRLVAAGTPFRASHDAVGAAVRGAVGRGLAGIEHLDLPAEADVGGVSLDDLVAAQSAGGGPGAFDAAFAEARGQLDAHTAWLERLRARLAAAQGRLDEAVGRVRGARGEP